MANGFLQDSAGSFGGMEKLWRNNKTSILHACIINPFKH